jgi:hypothetical protein
MVKRVELFFKMDMKLQSLYDQVIDLLNQAYSAQKFAGMRSRYAHEGEKADEVIAAYQTAHWCWFKAKEIYCSNKDMLDLCYRERPDKVFNVMVEVIDKEAQEAVEKEVLK